MVGLAAAICTLYWPASTDCGGLTLTLSVLDSPALSGIEVSSWVPYCSLKVVSKPAGPLASRLKVWSVGASFLTSTSKSKADFGEPRSAGSLGVTVTLAGAASASASEIGRSSAWPVVLPSTVKL